MLAHAATSADETLSVFMLFAGLWVGWAGWSRLKGRGFPRLPIGGAYALLGVGLTLAIGAAIVPRAIFGPPTAALPTPSVTVRPRSPATLSFVRPEPDQVERDATLDVVLSLQGGTIVDTASTNLSPTTGHVHISLDGKLVSMTYGLVQEIGLQGLAPGPHILEAEYVAADHGPFDPRVMAKVTFRVAGAGP